MDQGPGTQSASDNDVRLGGALLDDDAVHQLLQQVTKLAQHSVSGAQSVSLTVAQGDQYRTTNSTGPDALEVDEAQYRDDDGPCLQAMRSQRQLKVSVGADRNRWPLFDDAAQRHRIGGVLSTPLVRDDGESIGALNVYATSDDFPKADTQAARMIGEHATILVGYALALADSSQLNEQLRQAIATREVIGAAKGILMESQSCTREYAFDILRRASQRENRKLRDIAEELVERVEARAVKRQPQK